MCFRVRVVYVLLSLITLPLWAGIYRDDFNERPLRKDWRISAADYPKQPERDQRRRVPAEKVSIVNQGRLTLDASLPAQEAQSFDRHVTLFFDRSKAADWTDYTFSTRFRFKHLGQPKGDSGAVPRLRINLRAQFALRRWTGTHEYMQIWPTRSEISVGTFVQPEPPQFEFPFRQQASIKTNFRSDRWYVVKINTKGNRFRFSLNGKEIADYVNEDAFPGLISMMILAGVVVEVDYVELSAIPNFQGTLFVPTRNHFTVTWGQIKSRSR